MLLSKLVQGMDIVDIRGNTDINGIAYDSRKVRQGSLFVCIDGTITDGHKYIPSAIENGAVALLTQKKMKLPEEIAYAQIKDTRFGLAYVSDKYYGHPSGKFKLVGITGTKGKTTITYMLKSVLDKAGQKTGLVGTVEKLIGNRVIYMERTTPESYDLQSLFSEMVENKVDTAVMEVSSQGLKLHRVACCDFDIGIFNNITRAHIGPGEHTSFEDYLDSKIKLFKTCRKGLVNIDSNYSREVLDKAKCDVLTYGINNNADIKALNIAKYSNKVVFDLDSPWYNETIEVGVPGNFSVYNSLAAIGACGLLGISSQYLKKGLERVDVKGRVEAVRTGRDFTVIIDYAHSPDSLKNILETTRDFASGRVVCLFGCGGDRDRMMRPMMGKISGELSDVTIITSDNPRTEEPAAIVRDIEEGIKKTNGEYVTIVNRKEAIEYALRNAKKGDVVILAGKGHETYQTFKDKTIHFDEREVVREVLELIDG